MAYDQSVAERVRASLKKRRGVTEKRMFGGLAFMLRAHMCCGVIGDELMVRVGPEGYEAALSRPHARKMDFIGKPLRGFVYVTSPGFASARDLAGWIARATKFNQSLPSR